MFTKRVPFKQRFEASVSRGEKEECWMWNRRLNSSGYGTIREPGRGGRMLLAHRASFQLHIGPIPEGLCVCHRCDVRACVNPEHLFLGTNLDNVKDRDAKGRCRSGAPHGESNGNAKLNSMDALAIKSDTRTHKAIAADYGISRSTVTNIKLGLTWARTLKIGPFKEQSK